MTKHCLSRTRERVHISIEASENFVARAKMRGLTPDMLPAKERNYMRKKEATEGMHLLYYSGFLFVVSDTNLCITMYLAPGWFFSKTNYDGKTQIKHPNKYYKHYPQGNNDFFEEAIDTVA